MMLRLVICLAIAFAIASPAHGQGFDLGKVLGKFQRPYRCGQCRDAVSELASQVCYEATGSSILPEVITTPIKDACEFAIKAPLKFIRANDICEPFGVCRKKYKQVALTCLECPIITRVFVQGTCNALPQLPNPIPFVPNFFKNVLRDICNMLATTAFGADLKGPCKEAGFCP